MLIDDEQPPHYQYPVVDSKDPGNVFYSTQNRLSEYARIILREFQLFSVARLFKSRHASEPKKVAVYQSRIVALLLTLVHWIPVGGALCLLILNGKGIIVAQQIQVSQNNLYQVGAKIFELLMP